uniref:Uncharacterized protein n=1 Tax=Setaria italica TaxID=4555 RepID=K3ZBT4_SETIT
MGVGMAELGTRQALAKRFARPTPRAASSALGYRGARRSQALPKLVSSGIMN